MATTVMSDSALRADAHVVAERRRAHGRPAWQTSLAEHVDGQRAAELGAHVVHGEILDVDAGVAERDGDLLKHAGPVAGSGRSARYRSPGGRLPAASMRSRCSAGSRDGVARGARRRSAASASSTSCRPSWNVRQRRQQRGAVVEEDVGPDAAVAAGDARQVAEARTRREQRVARARVLARPGVMSTLASTCGRWLTTRHQPVVLLGVDRDRARADARRGSRTAAGRRRRRHARPA